MNIGVVYRRWIFFEKGKSSESYHPIGCALMHDLHFIQIGLCFTATGVDVTQEQPLKLLECVLKGVLDMNYGIQ